MERESWDVESETPWREQYIVERKACIVIMCNEETGIHVVNYECALFDALSTNSLPCPSISVEGLGFRFRT